MTNEFFHNKGFLNPNFPMIKKRTLLWLSLTGAMTASLAAETSRPNVLLLLVDDLKPAIGAYGDPVANTPGLDRLASMGTRFELAYCNQAVCMASRYNLLLGSRSTSTGFYNFGTEFREVYPDAITLPQHFKNAGYQVESMGKVFHIGHGNTNDAASWSVPHHKDKVIEYLLEESKPDGLTREEAFFTNAPKHLGIRVRDLPRGAAWESPDVLDEAYADGRVATHAIDRMRELSKNPDQPFFLAVGFARPHLPFSAPRTYWDLYDRSALPMPEFTDAPDGTPMYAVKRGGEIRNYFPIPEATNEYPEDLVRTLIHGYYASVSYMDAQLNRVLDELERLGLQDNTIIVLWGDHGFHLGDHSSWTKHSNFEQANRIPLMIVAPGVSRAGSSTKQLAETVDIYPTLAELAGLPLPATPQPVDGKSLVSVLRDPGHRVRDHAYHAYPRRGPVPRIGCAIRTERYRLVAWIPWEGDAPIDYELYDYREDPLETRNLADERPEVLAKLTGILARHPDPVPQVKRN